jgi:hypothetical protein
MSNTSRVFEPIDNKIISPLSVISSSYESYERIKNGEGSVSGQISYQAGKTLLDYSIIGEAANIVDFTGNAMLKAVGSEHELKISGTMDKMFEDAFDPVARENRQDKMFKNLSDSDIQCIADPESCNMNTFENYLFILGELYRDRD